MTDRFYDNTRLTDYRRCPRYFYFRHERGWVREEPEAAPVFGISWGSAMDSLWHDIALSTDHYDKEKILLRALGAFTSTWVKEGMPALDEIGPEEYQRLGARHPGTALEMLYAYFEQREDFIKNKITLLAIERPFAVPLDPNDPTLFYVGRMDKEIEIEWNGRVYPLDHKTTASYAKSGGFRSMFLDSFSPNSQVEGYIFSAKVEYKDKLKGVLIDAALVHKTEQAFRFIPIEKEFEQIDAWLWETHDWIRKIEADKAALFRGEEKHKRGGSPPYLSAFPKNTNSCHAYNRPCPYLDPCRMWPNPIGKDLPPGFKESRWSPFEKLGLSELGLSEG